MDYIIIIAFGAMGVCAYQIYKYSYYGIGLFRYRYSIRKHVKHMIKLATNSIYLYTLNGDDKHLDLVKTNLESVIKSTENLTFLKEERERIKDILFLVHEIKRFGFDKVIEAEPNNKYLTNAK